MIADMPLVGRNTFSKNSAEVVGIPNPHGPNEGGEKAGSEEGFVDRHRGCLVARKLPAHRCPLTPRITGPGLDVNE